MSKFFTNNFSITSVYKKPSTKSEIVTQMIFGDSFLILKKAGKWLKIKIKEDNYKGFIKDKKFSDFIRASHKVKLLKANVYKYPSQKNKVRVLSFGSKIKVIDQNNKFYKFTGGWIKKNDTKPILIKEKNLFKKVNIFKNVKYKWGGKSFKGIDCSALVQVFMNYNNLYCPRDTKDQLRYFKKNISLYNVKKNDILYWKGHVAIALSKKSLIHAYGPSKKTVTMNTLKTINLIKKTANLKLLSIKRVRV